MCREGGGAQFCPASAAHAAPTPPSVTPLPPPPPPCRSALTLYRSNLTLYITLIYHVHTCDDRILRGLRPAAASDAADAKSEGADLVEQTVNVRGEG